MRESSGGYDELDCMFTDERGGGISFCALGANALEHVLVLEHKVVCFFGTGRGPIGNEAFC
eukprot:1242103-Karenia_brevis.AAC.1